MRKGKELLHLLYLLLIIGIDQITKYSAVIYLKESSVILIPGILELNYVQNQGAAFGIMQNANTFFLVITPIILCAMFLYIRIKENKEKYILPLVLIAGGAAGNYTDRIHLGYVVDFIDFKVWPVFNFADSCIVIGAILFAVILIREDKSDRIQEEENAPRG